MNEAPRLLIIVHPGSACGSAEMNIGYEAAEEGRLDMQTLVQGWEGPVFVIDGSLSDELSGSKRRWADWGHAIDEALGRAREAGLMSQRIMGCDSEAFNQRAAVCELVREHSLMPGQVDIVLTGAWIDDSGDGCVNDVREQLEELGFKPTIESAMNLDAENDLDTDVEPETETPLRGAQRKPR